MAARNTKREPSDRVTETTIRVLYGDVDQMGVAYYANHFRWFEASRGDYIRSFGGSYAELEEQLGVFMPVVEAHARYRAPARYDDALTVLARIAELGFARCRFEYELRRGEELLAEGYTVHACIDHSGRVRRFPDALLDRLGAIAPSGS